MLIKLIRKENKAHLLLNDSVIVAVVPKDEGSIIVYKTIGATGYNSRIELEVVESLDKVFAMSRFKEV